MQIKYKKPVQEEAASTVHKLAHEPLRKKVMKEFLY